ncbi:hypothetical protein F5887DRAFT_1076389 [Amanita rubescens]|nr:hypothetical protein F5887DRAFT_1076389 [Amanita rubescens]
MASDAQRAAFGAIAKEFESDPALCSLIAHAQTDEGRTELDKVLCDRMAHHGIMQALHNVQLVRSFLTYCTRNKSSVGKNVCDAIAHRHYSVKKRQRTQRKLVDDIGLNWKSPKQEQRCKAQLATIPVITVVRLDEPYPPPDHWVCDTPKIHSLWRSWIKKHPMSNKNRKPFMHLDLSKIKIIPHTESVQILDHDGKLVGLVIRNFCRDLSILEWINQLIERAVGLKKSCRPNDPGSLVIIGFSPGARHRPSFGWVRNIIRKIPEGELEDFDYECSSAFALFWNLARSWLPGEIIQDFDDFIESEGLPPMNSEFQTDGLDGTYTAVIKGVRYNFTDARLAPPQGYFGGNYAAPIHKEEPPHEWAISWTTGRDPVAPDAGGQFYMAQYGIQIEQCPNTLIAWKPRDFHGTSLQCYDPKADVVDFLQTGMSFSTSDRLASQWHAVIDKLEKLGVGE